MSQQTKKLPFQRLPLAPTTLQTSLPRLNLDDRPSAQRRATTFKTDTDGVWARVYPLWTTWPLRLTKEEIEEMGIDIEKGEQVSVEDVLKRWDPIEPVDELDQSENDSNGLQVTSSKHRSKIQPVLLGISSAALQDTLPQLDVGDAVKLCAGKDTGEPSESELKARQSLADILGGKNVLVSKETNDLGPVYGPWATRYCGHQFGSWAGQLGDGRATSLIETVSPSGIRTEVQLKGAGRTPFSRTADGLAVLRSGVREYLGSEAVAALGIPTTRALALLTVDDLPVIREDGPEPPSLLARLAPSFIRIGHFEALNPSDSARKFSQIFLGGGWVKEETTEEGPLKGQGNLEGLRDLTEWGKSMLGYEGDTLGFLKEVARRNAEMVGKWQVYGYMHGVLNTDNISILGLTIDYGPYAFMDVFDEGHICNHSDPSGLYSYRRQPERVLFALDKLASALSPLIGYEAKHGAPAKGFSEGKTAEDVQEWDDDAVDVLQGWEKEFEKVDRETQHEWWMKRFGLLTEQKSDGRDIVLDFLVLLRIHSIDFHASFRRLSAFDPLKAREEASYARVFAAELVAETTLDLPSDSVEPAITALAQWLDVYTARVLLDDEVAAWKTKAGGEEWASTRLKALQAVNPRFVLRQWVLEEVIGDLTTAGFSDEGLQVGREKLSRVLDASDPSACLTMTDSRWPHTPSSHTRMTVQRRARHEHDCAVLEERTCLGSNVAAPAR